MARQEPEARQAWRRSPQRGFGGLAILLMVALISLPAAKGMAEEASLGGPFELTDHHGDMRTDRDFHGSYLLIYFGFTRCPDLCPTTLAVVGHALDALAERAPAKAERVAPLFVTVDPPRDTAEVLESYVASFHPRLIGLTGTAEQVEHMAKSYGAYYAPVPIGGGDYIMDHSGFILLMGPEGEYVTHFESDVVPSELAAALERWVGG
jgi:protein SCO1/2